MCAAADADPWDFFQSKIVKKSRKQHKCCECGRTIKVGESYEKSIGKYDYEKRFWAFKTCIDCVDGPCAWLKKECGGYLFEGVYEDLMDHWENNWTIRPLSLGRLIVSMRRKWGSGDE